MKQKIVIRYMVAINGKALISRDAAEVLLRLAIDEMHDAIIDDCTAQVQAVRAEMADNAAELELIRQSLTQHFGNAVLETPLHNAVTNALMQYAERCHALRSNADELRYQLKAKEGADNARRAQLERIDEWLVERGFDDVSDGDTAAAVIRAGDLLRDMLAHRDEQIQNYNQELDRLHQQLPEMEAEKARLEKKCVELEQELATVRAQVVERRSVPELSAVADAADDGAPPMRATFSGTLAEPIDWPGELADWVEGIEAGRHTWRTLPRQARWKLVAHFMLQLPDTRQSTFDAMRPTWMASASGTAGTFGNGSWQRVMKMVATGSMPS